MTEDLNNDRITRLKAYLQQAMLLIPLYDKGDESLLATALRETWEEMGILSRDIKILGSTDNFLTNTNFMVTPYVGYFPYPYNYKINQGEISQIIEVPLHNLLDPKIFEIRRWERDGIIWDVHFYHFDSDPIWGVTGFLLSNFLSIVFELSHIPDLRNQNNKTKQRSSIK